ncbi:class I SAM-dependent methyltransferase [Desulfolutivibrio sulfoxidireducens]|uniref:class I SAM-dependent methyltransferase n=1 Tax=Desulfolutivibrio sulfoxidireducens TaxID=2773299 RepID=UPI00159DBFD0|nr:methyltransferase domain-containing protein [Desulfolutivibrio sulfoxidireducens]QLA14814.1 methyltransferase domain-containing protein [Desulfolutivibrio sulfoxidireducens]QLA18386.1 methyltransferase domain-containing protein [Desulfolutivibrio sulfoxidireducens]
MSAPRPSHAPGLENGSPRAAAPFFRQALELLGLGRHQEALAFLDGALLQFGPGAATPEALAARAAILAGLGLPRDTPPPWDWPGGLEDAGTACAVCGQAMGRFETLHGKDWLYCPGCRLLHCRVDEPTLRRMDLGEADGAKKPADSVVHRRELYFCTLFLEGLAWSRVLLYGAGWSLVPGILSERGIHAVGCDLWRPLIAARRSELGPDRFFHRDELPATTFDLISAFEVFEHFARPGRDAAVLADRLAPEGAIVGCTDFWHGGSLARHPSADAAYWRHGVHVTAWTYASMRRLASGLGLTASFFKVDTPGFAAKVFFVLHRGARTGAFVASLPAIFQGVF